MVGCLEEEKIPPQPNEMVPHRNCHQLLWGQIIMLWSAKKTNILPALITSSYPYIPRCKDPPRFIFREEHLATQEEFSLSLFPAPPLE